MSEIDEVVRKLRSDLAWLGPSGKAMGNVVLSRQQAELMLSVMESLAKEYVLDHGIKNLHAKYGITVTITP